MLMDSKKAVTSDTLAFIKEKVLNITDITRTTMLTDILNSYADKTCTEIYVIQNSRKKESQAVIADLEYFQELLRYKEAIEATIDEMMLQTAIDRKDDVADVGLNDIIRQNSLDVDRILALADETED